MSGHVQPTHHAELCIWYTEMSWVKCGWLTWFTGASETINNKKRPSETQAQKKREWPLEFFNVPIQFTITIPRKYPYFPPGQILSASSFPQHHLFQWSINGKIFMRMYPQEEKKIPENIFNSLSVGLSHFLFSHCAVNREQSSKCAFLFHRQVGWYHTSDRVEALPTAPAPCPCTVRIPTAACSPLRNPA